MLKVRLLLISILLSATISAQTIHGIIKDKSNNVVEGVHVFNHASGNHSHSNNKGMFTLQSVNVGDSLSFRHINFETKTVVVNSLLEPFTVVINQAVFSIDEIIIAPKIDALKLISEIDIQVNPVNSSQDILKQVPGLIIGQHAGGGKAEQIFLRGFDIDHGTDITITVDGLPVNMVSHAHGQGYADLHFLIPETIEKTDFGKGPYYANQGNFNTAGYVNFETKENPENSLIKLEVGDFGTKRLLGLFDVYNSQHHNAYFASEYIATDGPFESPQNFNRINLFGKYTGKLTSTDKLGVTASYFTSKWDASGQIPQRAVDDGSISRFGAIDDTEGGFTDRTNILINHDKNIDKNSFIKNFAYYSKYNFELYSNFTFFLNDPINGDQIKQKESRDILGFCSEYNRSFSGDKLDGLLQFGINLRNDQSKNNELTHTVNRKETLDQIQLGNINEINFGSYVNAVFSIEKWTINPSIRLDYFDFQYNDALATEYQTQTQKKSILSPKLNILYNHTDEIQWYIKGGKGFHSNDTRVVVAQNGREIIPGAYGSDLGFIWKPVPKIVLNSAFWYLYMEQEFVYVGDEGVVEPSGKSSRKGMDVSMRYQPFSWLFWNFDANYAYARAKEEPEGENYIPLAPDFTLASGLNIIHQSGFYGGTNIRMLKDRPANEDNSIIAIGYTVVDLNAGYEWEKVDLGIQIQNLFNAEWNETQFATESRLQNEVNPVEEIHFIPGTPFYFKATIAYKF